MKDLRDVRPGYGYTGHSFNDWNHVDATAMLGGQQHNENKNQVEGIAYHNQLGPGIKNGLSHRARAMKEVVDWLRLTD